MNARNEAETEALAVLELETIHRGVAVLDEMMKASRTRILAADPIPPGRFLVVVGGAVAEVEVAWRRGGEVAGPLHGRLFLPEAHPGLLAALRPGPRDGGADALGLFETASVAAGFDAADRGLKDAAVRLVHLHLARGIAGKTFGLFEGRQDMVEAALAASEERARAHGRWVGATLLARPDEATAARLLAGRWGFLGEAEVL